MLVTMLPAPEPTAVHGSCVRLLTPSLWGLQGAREGHSSTGLLLGQGGSGAPADAGCPVLIDRGRRTTRDAA